MKRFFLDDIRRIGDVYNPFGVWKDAIIIRSYDEFISTDFSGEFIVSFDHDLGTDKTGFDCLKYLLYSGFIPVEVKFHSANHIGVANMKALWESYRKSLTL